MQHLKPWPLPFVGVGVVGFGASVVPTIVFSYRMTLSSTIINKIPVMDAYLPVAYESMLLVNAFKQIFSFGFSYSVVPWVTHSGFLGMFGAMAGINSAILLLALPLWYYGKQIRHKSASWKLILY